MIYSNSANKLKSSLGLLGTLDSAVNSSSFPNESSSEVALNDDNLCGIVNITSTNRSHLTPPKEVQLILSVTFNSTGTIGDLNNSSLSTACQSLGKIIGHKKMVYLDSRDLENFLFGENFTEECSECETPAQDFSIITNVAQIPVPICIASRPCGQNNESGSSTFAVHFTNPGIIIYGPFHLIELVYSSEGDLLFKDSDLPPLLNNPIPSGYDNEMNLWVKGSGSIPFKIDAIKILQLDNILFGAGILSHMSPSESLLNLFEYGLDISQWDTENNIDFQLNGMIEEGNLKMDLVSGLNFSVGMASARIFCDIWIGSPEDLNAGLWISFKANSLSLKNILHVPVIQNLLPEETLDTLCQIYVNIGNEYINIVISFILDSDKVIKNAPTTYNRIQLHLTISRATNTLSESSLSFMLGNTPVLDLDIKHGCSVNNFVMNVQPWLPRESGKSCYLGTQCISGHCHKSETECQGKCQTVYSFCGALNVPPGDKGSTCIHDWHCAGDLECSDHYYYTERYWTWRGMKKRKRKLSELFCKSKCA